MRFCICIPTYNGGTIFELCLSEALREVNRGDVYVIDSSSTDQTELFCRKAGVNLQIIDKVNFNHGGTRNDFFKLFSLECYDIIVYLTQDAILQSGSINEILKFFNDCNVGAVCGRQLPHDDANPLAKHARNFNYPSHDAIKDLSCRKNLGIKTVFISNSFAAYRISALECVHMFPSKTILCEDMYVAAKMILSGYKVGYSAMAAVKHSHNYTFIEEFKRYVDIGVFHAAEPWLQSEFGKARSEGLHYAVSELKYLVKFKYFLWLPKSVLASAAKYLGLKVGNFYRNIPPCLLRRISMHKGYWG